MVSLYVATVTRLDMIGDFVPMPLGFLQAAKAGEKKASFANNYGRISRIYMLYK